MGFIKLLAIVTAISFGGGFQYGYQVTSINPTQCILSVFLNQSYERHYHHNDQKVYNILWNFVVNIYFAGALLGVIATPFLAEKLGRRWPMFISNIFCILGNVLMGVTKYLDAFEMMIFNRFVIGIGIGIALTIQPVFISECVPSKYRGILSIITGLMVQAGITGGSIVSQYWFLGTLELWPVIFFVGIIPNALALVAVFITKESPKYQLYRSESMETIKETVEYYYGGDEMDVDEVISSLKNEIEITETQNQPWKEVLVVPHIRMAILLGSLVNLASGFCGIIVYSSYTTTFLISFGFEEQMAQKITMATSATTVVGCFTALYMVGKCGRRPMVIYGHVLLQILNAAILVAFVMYIKHEWVTMRYVGLAFIFVWLLIYGSGPITISWFITAEMVPQGARSTAQSIAIACGWIGRIIAGSIYLPLDSFQGKVGHYALVFYIVSSLIIAIFLAIKMPETKDKSVMEVIASLQSGRGGNSNMAAYHGNMIHCDSNCNLAQDEKSEVKNSSTKY